ncbi:MAG TPA: alpha/beta hydrolase [Bacilli bacterium]|nr:alpha/beta hydrolase [Bacilli bacterium]
MFIFRPSLKIFKRSLDLYEYKRIRKTKPFAEISGWKDIPYIADNNVEHLLDIYHPVGPRNNHLILDIHGGSYAFGFKGLNYIFNSYFVAKGFSVVAINYTLVKKGTSIYEQVLDIFAALNFLEANKEKYDLPLDNFILLGDSAGGHLALLTDLIFKSKEAQDYYGIKRLPDIKIKCVATNCGVYDFEEVVEYAKRVIHKSAMPYLFSNRYLERDFLKMNNPAYYIRKVKPDPVFVSSCHYDFLKKHSFMLRDELLRQGLTHHYEFEPSLDIKIGHVYNLVLPDSKQGKRTNDAMAEFFLRDFSK